MIGTVDRRTLLRTTGVGVLALVVVAGCSGCDHAGEAGNAAVVGTSSSSMIGAQFDPRNVHVDAGTELARENENAAGHTGTSASDNWSIDVEVSGGESATHTFAESGVYDAFCRFHGSEDLSGTGMKIAVGDATGGEPFGDEMEVESEADTEERCRGHRPSVGPGSLTRPATGGTRRRRTR